MSMQNQSKIIHLLHFIIDDCSNYMQDMVEILNENNENKNNNCKCYNH